ncbi:MAG: hypothetical protein AMS14_11390 [Planctomycetes bacterium DG_20]|nr:MAG: hypothetical protein AMS14_11390 [Planctomycetes bacterium DG_20]
MLTGAKSPDGIEPAAGSEGPLGDFSITNFSRNEPLEDGVTVSVTAEEKPASGGMPGWFWRWLHTPDGPPSSLSRATPQSDGSPASPRGLGFTTG